MASFDVQMFLSYIQADGYEPLTVEAVAYLLGDHALAQEMAEELTADPKSAEGEREELWRRLFCSLRLIKC
jgi:hypothetical protein